MQIIPIDLDKDLVQVEKVTKLAFSSTPDSNLDDWFSMDELRKSIIEGRGICLKAVDSSGEMIGTVHAMQENPINGQEGIEKWVIANLAVIPTSTSKGVGGQLLQAIEKAASNEQVKKMFVHTNLDDERVIHFYEKRGYEKAGKIKDYYYAGSAIFLLKQI